MLIFGLLLIALAMTVTAAAGRLPLWAPLFVVLVALLVAHWPAGWR